MPSVIKMEQMGRLGLVDPTSYSEPQIIKMNHVDIEWLVDFSSTKLSGKATLKFEILDDQGVERILLDSNELNINSVHAIIKGIEKMVTFEITDHVESVGARLLVLLSEKVTKEITLIIDYETSSSASGLAWLTPEQTCGKKYPYMFSQCQAIHARSILPCQDTPAVKFTYNAVVQHPENLTALMSAIRDEGKSNSTTTHFEQSIPIPAYLLAIAVGPLVSRKIGPVSKVYCEQEQIDAVANEFVDTNKFLETASDICGPYVWKEYNLLVLPPSFPFGGMENPTLTFVTPTIIAGDRSLVDVVAHEISHSWTGNLVTNKNFEHFWLNEGFTVFVEGKILGRIRGDDYRDFHAIHGLTELEDTIRNQLASTPDLQKLVVNLTNCSPDDAFSSVPYIKGMTFLRYIEELLGGPSVFEPFLRYYLNKFKFQSIETDDFKNTLHEYFVGTPEKLQQLNKIDWNLWLYSIGMPPIIPTFNKTLIEQCDAHAKVWIETEKIDEIKNSEVLQHNLTSPQTIEFLGRVLQHKNVSMWAVDKINLLSQTYGLDATKNSEIRFRYLRICIKARVISKLQDYLDFANSNYRMKFVRPIYKDLSKWKEVRAKAIENFEKHRKEMMQVCENQVANDLEIKNGH